MRSSLLLVALTLYGASLLDAAELPSRDVPARCAEPCGGAVFVCGGEVSDEIAREFVKRAEGDKSNIVVISTGDKPVDAESSEVESKWRARTSATITFLHIASTDEANRENLLAPLRAATGIWLTGTDASRVTHDLAGTKLVDELRAMLPRGGALGAASAAGAVLGDLVVSSDATDKPSLFPGLGVLKDLILVHGQSEGLEAALHKSQIDFPGRVGVSIEQDAALFARGRELKAIGASSVSFHLAPSTTRPARIIVVKAGDYEDLTALRRAAIDRAGKPFPEATPKPALVPSGSLVIVGGGRLPMDVRRKFVELSGGMDAKMVVIPIASNPPQVGIDQTRWLKELGVKNVVLLDPQSRAEAESPESLAKLKDATGIWFGGGRQWRTVDMYEGTACVEAFHEVLRRGGAIGGSSAGATIQGEYLVRGSPLRNTIMMAEGYERGFAFLPGAAIDQHFTQRKRLPDLQELRQAFPQLLGLGLDEGTAVIVHGSKMDVMGEGAVSVFPPLTVAEAESDQTDLQTPLVFKSGESLDLGQLSARRETTETGGSGGADQTNGNGK